MSDVNLNDLIKALRCLASQDQAGNCYEQYYNFNNNDQRISCYGSPDTIKCPYNQSTYDVCFEDGDCSEWLTKTAELLEELQQYRQIGTVNDFKKCKNITALADKNELANIIDEYAEYRKLGTVEQVRNQKRNLGIAYNMLGKYQEIGTPEECREAREKQQAKKYERGLGHEVRCPVCGTYTTDIFEHKYCAYCGQKME